MLMPLIKRKDTPESREFWEFVERVAREEQENRPKWQRREPSPDEQIPLRGVHDDHG
jgi:hypothetical protein